MIERALQPSPAHRRPFVTPALVAVAAVGLLVVGTRHGGLQTLYPVPSAHAASSNPDAASALVGVWRGSYICRQGETGVEVTITDLTADGAVKGRFHFFNMPGKSNAAEGEFLLSGKYDLAAGTLTMTPGEWIKQPENYVTAGFTAYYRPPAPTMAGTVDNNVCRQINLTKAVN